MIVRSFYEAVTDVLDARSRESDDEPRTVGQPFEVTVPTNLVILQKDSALNPHDA